MEVFNLSDNKYDRTMNEGKSAYTGSFGETTSAGMTVDSQSSIEKHEESSAPLLFPKPKHVSEDAINKL